MKRFIATYPLATSIGVLFAGAQIILILIYQGSNTSGDFGDLVREIGRWIVLMALLYKIFIAMSLLVTANKNKLDKAWNWNQASIASYFLYAFISQSMDPGETRRSVFWSVIWYEIWVQMALSCAVVSYYVVKYRIAPMWGICFIDGKFCGWRSFWYLLRGNYDG